MRFMILVKSCPEFEAETLPQTPDPDLHIAYLGENRRAPVRRVLSNSFGFGGSNASLVFGVERG